MEEELQELKSVFRSLVVSTPTRMDAMSLLRDYRNMFGSPVPSRKFGYSDPVKFLREKFHDCFIFQGSSANPELTLIVPEELQHLDNFVQKQRVAPALKYKGKRRSVPEQLMTPSRNTIASTFVKKNDTSLQSPAAGRADTGLHAPERATTGLHTPERAATGLHTAERAATGLHTPERAATGLHTPERAGTSRTHLTNGSNAQGSGAGSADTGLYTPGRAVTSRAHLTNGSVFQSKDSDENIPKRDSSNYRVHDFLKKRALLRAREDGADAEEHASDAQSGRSTSLSSSSSRKLALEELKRDISEIIADHPKGVWCTDLLGLYRERHGRELNFLRFGYTSLLSVACEAEGVLPFHYPERGDWLLMERAHAAAAPPPAPRPRRNPLLYARPPTPVDPDDALPGIPYDPEVFPEDCMGLLDSIPGASLAGVAAGDSLPVIIGEVYSPSHFWMLRLGRDHYAALDRIMDEMNVYYKSGEGRSRQLLPGAVRVGYYCSSCYQKHWHRSLIVKVINCTTVKVRHVDYGTVESCAVSELRLLPRRWAELPAQAIRTRLAAVRPVAEGRRWPRPAAQRFLDLVTDKELVAVLCALDLQDDILEVYLVNTETEDDVCIGDELIASGYAAKADVGAAVAGGRGDPADGSTIATSECYLYPRFAALENGDTLSFSELYACLRDGILPDCLDEYRLHVPPIVPPSVPNSVPNSVPTSVPPGEPPSVPPAPPAPPTARLVHSPPPSDVSESTPPPRSSSSSGADGPPPSVADPRRSAAPEQATPCACSASARVHSASSPPPPPPPPPYAPPPPPPPYAACPGYAAAPPPLVACATYLQYYSGRAPQPPELARRASLAQRAALASSLDMLGIALRRVEPAYANELVMYTLSLALNAQQPQLALNPDAAEYRWTQPAGLPPGFPGT